MRSECNPKISHGNIVLLSWVFYSSVVEPSRNRTVMSSTSALRKLGNPSFKQLLSLTLYNRCNHIAFWTSLSHRKKQREEWSPEVLCGGSTFFRLARAMISCGKQSFLASIVNDFTLAFLFPFLSIWKKVIELVIEVAKNVRSICVK